MKPVSLKARPLKSTIQVKTSGRVRPAFRRRRRRVGQLPPRLLEQRRGQALSNHPGSRWWCRKVRQLGHQELKVHPVGGARFTHWNRQCNFEWILCDLWKYQGVRLVFHRCRGMGRERFEVVDDARRASERHQFLAGVLHKVAGRASAH